MALEIFDERCGAIAGEVEDAEIGEGGGGRGGGNESFDVGLDLGVCQSATAEGPEEVRTTWAKTRWRKTCMTTAG